MKDRNELPVVEKKKMRKKTFPKNNIEVKPLWESATAPALIFIPYEKFICKKD